MPISVAILNEVQAWLKQQHIVVPSDWVAACIEWLKQEYQNENLPMQNLKNHVYEQWLVADLQEIGVHLLPTELFATQKTTLNGCFALQVNGVRDVGKPAYHQLKQISGTMNENAQVSAAPQQSLPEWEAKPTRMLMLNLTDGITSVQGMEYKQIPFLSIDLPPGVKVLITGPVDCRFGVLMLTPEKVKILGGGVEALAEKYSKIQILRDALQLGNENGAENMESGYYGSESSGRNTNPEIIPAISINRESELYGRSYAQSATGAHSSNTSYSTTSSRNTKSTNKSVAFNCIDNMDFDQFESDDDFVESLDYNALDEIERTNSAKNDDFPDNYEESEDEDMMNEIMAFQAQARVSVNNIVTQPTLSNPLPSTSTKLPQIHATDNKVSHLNVVLENLNHTVEFSVTIKGFISEVISKLECTSMGWQLTAKISDDTSSLEANIHDKVLHEFIGISAKEMLVLQKQASESSEIRSKIAEALTKCRKVLQDLNVLMEIRFSPNFPRPLVIKFTPLHE